jgi:hypothetical protein
MRYYYFRDREDSVFGILATDQRVSAATQEYVVGRGRAEEVSQPEYETMKAFGVRIFAHSLDLLEQDVLAGTSLDN